MFHRFQKVVKEENLVKIWRNSQRKSNTKQFIHAPKFGRICSSTFLVLFSSAARLYWPISSHAMPFINHTLFLSLFPLSWRSFLTCKPFSMLRVYFHRIHFKTIKIGYFEPSLVHCCLFSLHSFHFHFKFYRWQFHFIFTFFLLFLLPTFALCMFGWTEWKMKSSRSQRMSVQTFVDYIFSHNYI